MGLKILSFALAAATLSACDSADSPAVFTTTLTAKSASGVIPGVFAVGEPITFVYVMVNNTDRTQDMVWCAHIELFVYDAHDNLVWNVSDGGGGQVGCPVMESFAPGEAHTRQTVWHQDYNDGILNVVGDERAPRGAYYAVAEGLAFDAWDGTPQRFYSGPVDFLIR